MACSSQVVWGTLWILLKVTMVWLAIVNLLKKVYMPETVADRCLGVASRVRYRGQMALLTVGASQRLADMNEQEKSAGEKEEQLRRSLVL